MKTIKKAQNGTVAKDKTVVKKTVMKKQELAQKPTYKNLSMAVDVDERVTPSRGSKTPTKQDSLDYASGFKKGLSRKKDLFENTVGRSGRWEGENTPKKYIGKKKNGGSVKAKNGKPVKKAFLGGLLGGAGKSMLGGMGKQMLGGLAGKALGGLMGKNGKTVKKAQDGKILPIKKSKIRDNPAFELEYQKFKHKQDMDRMKLDKERKAKEASYPKSNKAKSGSTVKKCKYGCK